VWLAGTLAIPRVANRPGRPQKQFSDASDRSKRRKTEDVRNTMDVELLIHATQLKLRSSGKRDASQVLKAITSSPTRATKYKKAFASQQEKIQTKMTSVSALAMFVEAGLSRRQYEMIRNTQKQIYPCYSSLQSAKIDCYPDKEAYRVTETCAEVELQNLLDHTVTRLLTYLEEIVQNLSNEESNSLLLLCKWGCDGSQQTQYKQKFQNDCNSDSNIFQSSFVPLQLICQLNKKLIWQNPTPSSPRYCRPIRIRFVKESNYITNDVILYMKSAISSLRNSSVTLANKIFSVKHTLMFTMVDGKVCNAATQTSSTMRCYICGKTSKNFNNLTIEKEVKQEALQFGLSILHARIRLFESILHLGYKLPVQKSQLRSQDEKAIVQETKLKMQQDFKNKMGLIVDVPKPGFGNTNDGNTSRRFFADPDLAAEITGVDINLIFRFKVILEVISSGHEVDTEKFSAYATETAELYIRLYPWHPMTPTMHKILVHRALVTQNALLPIGQLSEEAAEARNKHFRLYRQNFARKFSRVSCNLDVLNRLLLSSDPVITGMRLKETIAMLRPALPYLFSHAEESDDEESSEERHVSSDEEAWQAASSD
jgi:hypothetical protein